MNLSPVADYLEHNRGKWSREVVPDTDSTDPAAPVPVPVRKEECLLSMGGSNWSRDSLWVLIVMLSCPLDSLRDILVVPLGASIVACPGN